MLKHKKENTNVLVEKQLCLHCNEQCEDELFDEKGHAFCCSGCKMAYHLLSEHGLLDFYSLNKDSGKTVLGFKRESYDYLDDPDVLKSLLTYSSESLQKVELTLPQIHCSSCLYLLEKLHRFHAVIHSCRVNFFQRKASILFDSSRLSLKELVILLTKIGYAPQLSYEELVKKEKPKASKSLYYKLGIAGFSFGNIMLLSFPEYLGFHQAGYHFYIGYINIFLAIPVVFYCGVEYLKSACTGLQRGHINIDLPIAMGILALFGRSIYEILSLSGEGYLDSLSGFVFFLLIGKWYQNITYRSIDFDRNYKSYFPISIQVKIGEKYVSRSIEKLEKGDTIRVRSGEIIPADGILIAGKGEIDYSFVTGESQHVTVIEGDRIYAGGRQVGASITLKTDKTINQSYLTKLWEDEAFSSSRDSNTEQLMASISKYFSIVVIVLALLTLAYWWHTSPTEAFKVFTTVLIVACPCALALSIPFSYGNLLRIFSGEKLYIKNTGTLEKLQKVNHIVFDKTGTLTDVKNMGVRFEGKELSKSNLNKVYTACLQSGHPLSRMIVRYLEKYEPNVIPFSDYKEHTSKGIELKFGSDTMRLGSENFVFGSEESHKKRGGVYLELNGKYLGHFSISQAIRENIDEFIRGLNKSRKHKISLLSGDDDRDLPLMRELLGQNAKLHFYQSPMDKLEYVKELQKKGEKVMMIGDGLNDAGALKQSDVGIIVSDDQNNFVPACDAIISGDKLDQFGRYLNLITKARYVVFGLIALSFLYNLVGLSFAMKGAFTPVVAAILMPLSSITIVMVGLFSTWILAISYGMRRNKILD